MRRTPPFLTLCMCLGYFAFVGFNSEKDRNSPKSEAVEARNPYSMYDGKFAFWVDALKESIRNDVSLEVALFIQSEVAAKFDELVVYAATKEKDVELLRSVIEKSTRIRWPLEGDNEVRVSIEKMAAARITISAGQSEFDIYISLSGFQERTSGFYLEFTNTYLQEWVDCKVAGWCEMNPGHSAYDIETGKLMPLLQWYNFNTRYHRRDSSN